MTLKSHLFKQVPHLFLEKACSHFSGSRDGSKTFYVTLTGRGEGRPAGRPDEMASRCSMQKFETVTP